MSRPYRKGGARGMEEENVLRSQSTVRASIADRRISDTGLHENSPSHWTVAYELLALRQWARLIMWITESETVRRWWQSRGRCAHISIPFDLLARDVSNMAGGEVVGCRGDGHGIVDLDDQDADGAGMVPGKVED